jgi:trans-aconitate methyltransferase
MRALFQGVPDVVEQAEVQVGFSGCVSGRVFGEDHLKATPACCNIDVDAWRQRPASKMAIPAPLDPLTAAHDLKARSAALFGRRRAMLPDVDAALAALQAAGRLRPDQQDYARFHRVRFAEAAQAIVELVGGRADWPACPVVEVGSSITPILYRQVFPHMRLYSACLFRHPQLEGVVQGAAQINFETADLREGAVLPFRDLGLVMLCEVLEHLVVNPANLFRSLAGSLAPGGLLYVTTPNFFRSAARAQMAAGRNPQPIYRAQYSPADRFHHHVREYSMLELLEAIREAGLSVEVAYYSDCWDSTEAAARLPQDAWQNLVVVGRLPN